VRKVEWINLFYMKTILLVLLLIVHSSLSGRILLEDDASTGKMEMLTNAQAFFDSIDPQDRDNFIVYYLRKGLMASFPKPFEPQEYSMFDDLEEPEDFSSDLLGWVKDKYALEDWQVVVLAFDYVICFSDGKCISPSDVGSNCCPF